MPLFLMKAAFLIKFCAYRIRSTASKKYYLC